MSQNIIQMPVAFSELFKPHRYKAYYGGRASGKSVSFAKSLVIQAAQKPLRILCAREIQNSIKDSVKRLLEDQIKICRLESFYQIFESEIRGTNGSLFLFTGLRSNPDNVRSTEGLDIAWVEEAQRMSQRSYEILYPTMRKEGSEIWLSWNPENEDDPVDKLFRGKQGPPPGSFVKQVNYDDNPFFPKVLQEAMEYDRKRDIDKYNHIWCGGYRKISEARVFKNWKIEELQPFGQRPYFGADWGFSTDPSVLVKFWIEGKKLYIEDEAWHLGCEIDDLPSLFAGTDERTPARWENKKRFKGIRDVMKWPVVADSARPETISYLKKRGFKIFGAKKGAGSVDEGVEFLKSFDISVNPKCIHTIDELSYYAYKVDEHTGAVLPILLDKKNHVIDSLRYGLEGERMAKRSAGSNIIPESMTEASRHAIY